MTSNTEPPSDKTEAQAGHLPPSYTTLFPQPADAQTAPDDPPQASNPRQPTPARAQKVETINDLRHANPRLALDPPLPQLTRFKTTEAAARTAMLGVGRAFKEHEKDPDLGLMAAHTAHAIALAVSTSRSYAAFVAATTAAESAALIISEDTRHKSSSSWDRKVQRVENAVWRAVESGLAAEAGDTTNGTWPSSTHDIDASTAAQGNQD